jgi:putative transcriptional regulator
MRTGRFQCYAGYSGWAPGQLERELAEGSWIVSGADAALVLDHPSDDVWSRALRDLGLDPGAIVPGDGEA